MIHSLIVKAGEKAMYCEDNLCRSGRGAVSDVEIRNVGSPIVLGEIPGIVAIVGCSNYPKGGKDVYDIAREFASRRYIVVLSGCSAMSAGSYRNSEGKTLYEEFPGGFEAGGVSNVVHASQTSHIAGAAIKVANIFAKRPLRGNYEEIADYIHNRLGAVGLAWGAYSQKAAAIGAGFWRLGVPVIVGPHGSKYRRMLLGRKENPENWNVLDARTGETVNVGPNTRTPIQRSRNQRRMHRPNRKTLHETKRHLERTRRKTQPLHRLTQTLPGSNAKRCSPLR